MKTFIKIAAVGAVFALAACARPMPDAQVQDPYAGAGGAGGVGSTALPGTAEYFKTAVGDTVLFAVDQSTLSPEGRVILANQAGWLNQNQGFSAVIEGHADEQGTREYNLALGARRANSVQEYLISQGVPPGRLRTVSYGKERPLAICSTEECYSKNRRAVTVVSPGAGM
ncbi:peptidoglycan-associated lipoprotein Pal [Paracoccus kondratievae]|uniref:Peptidoglycan-associated lipoprotein n=1 Tax=Paracoccus kondratievae TaxID=135740 RepID=A0AAD3NZQ4_9RHOB|nr:MULTISPECIES: peptidoglycan-associated lipoprotein Pal [Paracoccus]QFQ87628.1 peptidoglycan-associated lipoprotein Pal [Paracoccus kondratievae]GLK64927.1 peptidoglycan-associated lipoprotein [Paracoccus kondratievae]